MDNVLRQTSMTLKERLKQHVGFTVAVSARGYSSEPGLLQRAGNQFMRVNDQWFVPASLHQIELLGFAPPAVPGSSMFVRTVYRGSFSAKLLRTGADFIELQAPKREGQEWLLIPLNKVIGMEPA